MSYLPDSALQGTQQGALNSAENSLLDPDLLLNQQRPYQSIAFVDKGLADIETLVEGLENTQVVLIDEQQNGIDRITAVLSQYEDIGEVHVFSHASSGALKLGNAMLTHSTDRYDSEIEQWGRSLSSDADLLFYGCNFGATDEGIALMDRLAHLSGADIAASNDLTGIGGDWQLEVRRGSIESDVALSAGAQAAYDGTLALLDNGGFEVGLSNWTRFTGTETVSATDTFSGVRSLRLSEATSGASQVVAITAGETYQLSGTAKSSASGYAAIGIRFFDADFNSVGYADALVTGNQWQSYQLEEVAPASAQFAQVWAYKHPSNGELLVDDLALNTDAALPPPPPPNTELLDNPNFESGLNSWGSFTGKETASSADPFSGDRALRLSGARSGAGQFVRVIPSETYSLSGYGKSASTSYVGLGVNFYDGDYNYISAGPSAQIDGNQWTRYERSAIAPEGSVYAQVWTYRSDAIGDVFFDELSLKRASTSSPENSFIGLQSSTLSVNEAAGTVQVTVQRTGGSDGEVSVDYRTVNGSGRAATADTDYLNSAGTLTFAEGETQQSVLIPIVDDDLAEGAETFGFAIDNVRGGATLLAPRTAQITINDNDTLSYLGNQYVLTTEAKTWSEAQAEAQSLGGNLVTLNAAAEEAWVQQNFGSDQRFWIGLNDAATEGTFEWASGETVVYLNWAPGEPDNDGDQDFGVMNFGAANQWADDSSDAQYLGIIEIGDSNAPDDVEGNGLKGEYFNNIDFTNQAVVRTDANIEFNWGSGSPDPSIGRDTFSVRWTGQIEPLYSETYTFRTDTDDGVRLWVNNQLIIDKFFNQGRTEHTGSITLSAGQQYNIRMEYFENAGNAAAQLSWSSASQPLEVVPRSQLYSEPISSNAPIPETVVSNLDLPTAIEWRAGSEQMFIAEKGGKVRIYENDTLLETPFIDISAQVNGTRDRGLLDLALHPDFINNPYVYLLFTYDPPEVFNNTGDAGPDGNNNRASRLIRVTADVANGYRTAIAGSEVVLLGKNSTWENYNGFANSTFDLDEPEAGVLPDGSYLQDFLNSDSESHTIGSVEFGPDGALYVSNGDGASYNRVDPRAARVQDVDSLSGKILRIDPITGEGLADNPFFNGDADANRSKVYQLGLRNPFRMTIDPASGQLYIGDVGWTKWEEINAAGAGANFGWPYYEGGDGESLKTGGYADLDEAQVFYQSNPDVTPSLLGLNHKDDGINAIVMGDIYRGNVYADEYQGDLFFNDLGQGIMRNVSLDESGNVVSVDTFATGTSYVVQMIEGPDGLLYYVNLLNGTVGRWVFS